MQVDFLFDFSSPNAYLAHKMIPGIEQRTGVQFTYVPCLLGGIFRSTGNQSPMETNAHVANKIAYDKMELARFIAKNDVTDFRFNPHFQLRTVFLMRAATTFDNQSALRAYADAGMKMAWEDEVNINDTQITIAALNKAGFDGPALFAQSQEDSVKAHLFANTDAAIARGAFGMPTFYVDDEMFFGKDRIRDVEEEIISKL